MCSVNSIIPTLLRVIICILFVSSGKIAAQHSGCPMKDGSFKKIGLDKLSHYNPNDNAVILSNESDSVRCFRSGEVFQIFEGIERTMVVMIKIAENRFIVFRDLKSTSLQKGQTLKKGDMVGLARVNDGVFTSTISLHKKREAVNPRKYFACRGE
jgi:hypothetical protein